MPRPGIFRALGDRVMYGKNGIPGYSWGGIPVDNPAWSAPISYPVPEVPVYPASAYSSVANKPVNPAIREAEAKEVKEVLEDSGKKPDGRVAHKGSRKAYVAQWSSWLTKQEVIERLKQLKEQRLNNYEKDLPWNLKMFGDKAEKKEDLLKKIARDEFGVMKQYNLSKHEPLPHFPGRFGGGTGSHNAASHFYNSSDYEKTPDGKENYNKVVRQAWRNMSPQEQDAYMAQEVLSKNSPEKLKNKEARSREAENREIEKRAALRKEAWNNLSPVERDIITYNQKLAEYRDALEKNQYIDMMQNNQERRPLLSPELSPLMLDDFTQSMQDQQTRYVPIRPRRSISEKVMSSFDPRLFSPEFISEEEDGY